MANEMPAGRKYPGILWPAAITLVTVFLMGGVAGYLDAHHENGGSGPSGAVGAGLVLLIGIAVMAAYLRQFGRFWQNWSRRKRLYTVSVFGSVALGLIAAALMRSGQSDLGTDPFFSNSALTPGIAIALALLWSVGIGIAVTVYQRTVDDHEKHAYLWAGLAGYYAFAIPAPAWWVLSRANLLPPVDAMTLFVLSMVVNAAVYLWLKFR